ncbi:MAG: DNA recombination protein RmuC [Burkholderia sp.]|nr:DNA recombination protein RmuC [Burkholderia sp.]
MTAMISLILITIALIAVLVVVLMIMVYNIRRKDDFLLLRNYLGNKIDESAQLHVNAVKFLERILRGEIIDNSRGSRTELAGNFSQLQQVLAAQLSGVANIQNNQISRFGQQLEKLVDNNAQQFEEIRESTQRHAQYSREEQCSVFTRFGSTLNEQLGQLIKLNNHQLSEVRETLEHRLKEIEINNEKKLEEMRRTVDEKLHSTLEYRLGESFKLVSDRLEQVHRGLGEMQTLAAGVGDLKKVLTNIKTRGTWGEVQLETLLEQMLTSDQYAKNVATIPKSNERVEFAICLPGRHDGVNTLPVWLPIDAKFPREDYERLVDAQDRADITAVEDAMRALETRVKSEAKTIAEKYISPPHTTDFALLFLPTEGLYAEILRRPGLTDILQRDYRVTIAGPTTLAALLNSLQMGFRTIAIEKRSSEVWQVLSAVKTEFSKFGDVLARTKSQLETVTRSIEAAEQRTRVMNRKLKQVEVMPEDTAAGLLKNCSIEETDEIDK